MSCFFVSQKYEFRDKYARMDLFKTSDYREYLRYQIQTHESGWGLVTKMAKAAGCQRSHLSRVVNASSNLTSDQAFGLCRFWKFDPLRSEYFLKLVELARAATKEYRQRLETELFTLRKRNEHLADRLATERANLGEREAIYYGAWYLSAIHIIVSIPEFRTTSAIARRLELPSELVESSLKQLSEMGLVKLRSGKWESISGSIHLPLASPLLNVHHSNWKQRALLASQTGRADSVHYSIVQSVSRADYENIKEHFLTAIDKYRGLADPSAPEELVGLNIDFFRV